MNKLDTTHNIINFFKNYGYVLDSQFGEELAFIKTKNPKTHLEETVWIAVYDNDIIVSCFNIHNDNVGLDLRDILELQEICKYLIENGYLTYEA